ncbi:MAG: PilW family protein [Luteibacter sp.]
MCSLLRSAERRRLPRQAGFTVIELMVGVALGLFASLAVTHVLVNSEGFKRTTTSGSDAQVNGALALGTVQRSVQSAGYGFAATPSIIGCPITTSYKGVAVPGFPANLVPVVITNGATDAPDTIRVLASGKTSFSVPLRVVPPGYDPANGLTNKRFPVSATAGFSGPRKDSGVVVAPGDLVIGARTAAVACEMFEVRQEPGATGFIDLLDATAGRGHWNPAAYPAAAYTDGALLLNMGQPVDITYSIQNNALAVQSLTFGGAPDFAPSYTAATEAYPDIVNLQALYGKDTNADGSVDTWDNATPTTNAGWLQVVAVRVAVVSRNAQYEKEDVTHADLQWDLGAASTVPGSTACGANKCLALKVSHLDDWKRYRYRVFETVVPLRNMLWNS